MYRHIFQITYYRRVWVRKKRVIPLSDLTVFFQARYDSRPERRLRGLIPDQVLVVRLVTTFVGIQLKKSDLVASTAVRGVILGRLAKPNTARAMLARCAHNQIAPSAATLLERFATRRTILETRSIGTNLRQTDVASEPSRCFGEKPRHVSIFGPRRQSMGVAGNKKYSM